MESTNVICMAVLKSRVESLIQLGASKNDILGIIGLNYNQINNPEEMISLERLIMLENVASELINSDGVAFRIADECRSTGDAKTGLLGQVAASTRSIGEAFKVAIRFTKLMSNAVQISLNDNNNTIRFSYLRKPFRLNTVLDSELAIIDAYDILSKFGKIHAIGFIHKETSYMDRYLSRFNSEINFSQFENFIDFDPSILSTPNPYSQPYINKIITAYAEKLLEKFSQKDNLIENISKLILSNLASGKVCIEFVARELNMSRQTLFRRLKANKTSYTEIINQIQSDLSDQYQHSGNYTQQEIAFLLGFSDSSSYSRARKKWNVIMTQKK